MWTFVHWDCSGCTWIAQEAGAAPAQGRTSHFREEGIVGNVFQLDNLTCIKNKPDLIWPAIWIIKGIDLGQSLLQGMCFHQFNWLFDWCVCSLLQPVKATPILKPCDGNQALTRVKKVMSSVESRKRIVSCHSRKSRVEREMETIKFSRSREKFLLLLSIFLSRARLLSMPAP